MADSTEEICWFHWIESTCQCQRCVLLSLKVENQLMADWTEEIFWLNWNNLPQICVALPESRKPIDGRFNRRDLLVPLNWKYVPVPEIVLLSLKVENQLMTDSMEEIFWLNWKYLPQICVALPINQIRKQIFRLPSFFYWLNQDHSLDWLVCWGWQVTHKTLAPSDIWWFSSNLHLQLKSQYWLNYTQHGAMYHKYENIARIANAVQCHN